MKISDMTNNGAIAWQLPNISVEERIELFETLQRGTNLCESNDQNVVDQFKYLWDMSDKPESGDSCIVVPTCLVNNKILLAESKIEVMTYVSENTDSKTFDHNGTQKTYPSEVMSRLGGIWYTFVFLSTQKYSALQSMMIMSFDISLPDVKGEKL
jgi:hypothetical protein